MKNIILIAPPAAGKGTESAKLEQLYGLTHIATGDLLRAKTKENNELAKEINEQISAGKFVSDEIILKLIEERITKEDCQNGYILDGFPRDIIQAKKYDELLNKLNRNIGYIFVINMDKEIAASRIVGRRSCPNCGKIYNINFPPLTPKIEGKCDDCGCELIHRSDDNAETYDKRYNTYLEKTAPLIDYYKKQGVVYFVDGNINKDYTHKQIEEILNKLEEH